MVLEPATTTTTNKIYYYCFNIKKNMPICQIKKKLKKISNELNTRRREKNITY